MRLARHWILGLLMLAGCQHFDRARECRAIADSVNPELLQLAQLFGSRGPTASEGFRAASARYSHAAQQLRSLSLRDGELARLTRDLSESLMSVSRSCDRFAVSSREHGLDPTAAREFEGLGSRHRTVVSAIERHCRRE